MLTFKQSVVLLVSIVSVLAVIAIVTGLSPLYWPHPKTLSKEENSSSIRIAAGASIKSTNFTKPTTVRSKVTPTKKLPMTTVKSNVTISMSTMNGTVA